MAAMEEALFSVFLATGRAPPPRTAALSPINSAESLRAFKAAARDHSRAQLNSPHGSRLEDETSVSASASRSRLERSLVLALDLLFATHDAGARAYTHTASTPHKYRLDVSRFTPQKPTTPSELLQGTPSR